MDSFTDGAGTTLPLYATIPSTAVFLVLIIALLFKERSRVTGFLLGAIWLRYIVSAFPKISFQHSPVGLSWNALTSLLVVFLGLFFVNRRRLAAPGIWPIGGIIAALAISGVANHDPISGIDQILKYLYLLVVALAVVDAAQEIGFSPLLDRLLWIFTIPCVFQLESLLLGIAKTGESDGSRSYIGGYNHESGFSLVILTGILVVSLHGNMTLMRRLALIAWFGIAIGLANYRTAIVAGVPLLAYAIISALSAKIVPRQRVMFVAFLATTIVLLGVAALPLTNGRFDSLGVAFSKQSEIIKPPTSFTADDRELLSGRPYIWSKYYYGWKEGKPVNHLFGMGPDSWGASFSVYAHNTLVSALYETGPPGVIAVLMLWIVMAGQALRVKAPIRNALLAAHLSFFILNMATMPFWQIEGLVYYAILCGATLFWAMETNRKPAQQNIAFRYGPP